MGRGHERDVGRLEGDDPRSRARSSRAARAGQRRRRHTLRERLAGCCGQHAVLALLADGPSHGYQLRASFEQAVGPQWGGLNIGHVYQLLDRLSRDGLVRSERQPQPVKPDRLVYELTDAGRKELERWLVEPAERARGHRDDLFLKLLAAGHLPDPDAAAQVIRRQRTYLLRQLHALAQDRREPDRDPLNDLVAASAELHLRADLAVLDLAEATPLPTGNRRSHDTCKSEGKVAS